MLVGNLRITRTDGEFHIPVAGDGKAVAVGETYAEDIGALIHPDGAEYLNVCLAPESVYPEKMARERVPKHPVLRFGPGTGCHPPAEFSAEGEVLETVFEFFFGV